MNLYHGTSQKAYASIKQNGLQPGQGNGGDQWLKSSGWGTTSLANQTPSVFLTADKTLAKLYASRSAEVTNTDPVVLKVVVPSGVKLNADENDAKGLRVESPVPPSYVEVSQ